MEQVVTGCEDCPFRIWESDYEEHSCIHPSRENEVINFVRVSEGSPTWCPLKEEPITISINT